MADIDILGMSDEDFLKTPPTPTVATEKEATETPEVVAETAETTEEASATEEVAAEAAAEGEGASEGDEPAEVVKEGDEVVAEDASKKVEGEKPVVAAKKPAAKPAAKPADKAAGDAVAAAAEVVDNAAKPAGKLPPAADLESFYKRIMAPFKANGREIALKSPEEVIQLMQMGANYTRKMQELAPQRKLMTMLQNNGLLDEGKLSFLIDLERKDPEAIKKLIKDAGVNPLEIDTSVEPAYREGNHRVGDDEVAFHTTLDDMKSTPDRVETLKVINSWDQASKDALWKSPEIMTLIHGQRENGIYDRIAAEVTRRQTFFWLKKAIITSRKEQYFMPLASVTNMPKNYGKTIKVYEYVPLLDDRNVNDQGIDASGATIANGNLYGSSKDIGTITSKLPVLTENGGRVNRVGFTRLEREGSIQKFGFFTEFTQESLDFDSDDELMDHLSTELMNGAVQLTEAVLQKDLLAAAGVVVYAGAARPRCHGHRRRQR
jgi:hypothetical protein